MTEQWNDRKKKLKLNAYTSTSNNNSNGNGEDFIEKFKRVESIWGAKMETIRRETNTGEKYAHKIIVVAFDHHFGYSLKKSCAIDWYKGREICRFYIETIKADNKMETSFLTRYLWHLMILYIDINGIDLQIETMRR